MDTTDTDLFNGDVAQQRTVKLPSGKEKTFFFRDVADTTFRAWQVSQQGTDPEVRAKGTAAFVAAAVCQEDGSPAWTVDQARRLKPAVLRELESRAMEFCGYAPAEAAEAKKD